MDCFFENDEILREIEEIKEFAMKRKNFYDIDHCKWIPGEREEYILRSGTLRVVFSITKSEDRYFRHISISTIGVYPNPILVFHVCQLFGFGVVDVIPDPSWMIHVNEEEKAIHVIQEVKLKILKLILRNFSVFRRGIIANRKRSQF